MSERPILLEASDVAKHFGGVKALRGVSLTIREGEIYGLIGPNGAGKTTFFNCLTGLYVPNSGRIVFAGAELDTSAPHKVAARGIARTFQNIRLFAHMTALENVMVGRHQRTRAGVFGAIFQNVHHAVVRRIGARIRVAQCFLGIENPCLLDNRGDFFGIDLQHE